jgi:5'-nucleotidase (lipoprotein e(P4) family)
MHSRLFFFFLLASLLFACQKPAPCAEEASTPVNPTLYSQLAVLYQQHSSEYRALCYQTYQLAEWKLDQKLAQHRGPKKPAIVLDLDETVIDNSAYQGSLIREGKLYDQPSWKAWTDLAQADTVPGASRFLHKANKAGVTIFYISNRKEEEKEATMENLRRLGLPQVEPHQVLLRTDVSNKEPRRQLVLENHDILMLFGDNLNDLAEVFEDKLPADRHAATDSLRKAFGDSFIVLPNPMYGSWELALYSYAKDLTSAQIDSIRMAVLK